ncbi:MAG: 16S rRNA (cytosine(1402)-N(4))-methyltransferase RsmH [Patescibacteria group bacterium]
MPHVPVLLKEVLEYLDPKPGSFAIDGTADGGGHAEAILEKLTPQGTLLALDWDREVLEECKKYLRNPKNVIFVQANYADVASVVRKKKLPKADSLLLDVGFSSLQTDQLGRGFSFKKERGDEPLLMTYNDETKPVKDILREISEEELANIIRELGGERLAGRVARVIKEEVRRRRIETSGELADIIRKVLPRGYERGRIDPATRTFQALRIYANQELENLKKVLSEIPEIMNSGGRVAVISFHSLEDKIVKQAFKTLEKEGGWKIITKKPVPPTRQEILENVRSRSAKLRIIEKM